MKNNHTKRFYSFERLNEFLISEFNSDDKFIITIFQSIVDTREK